MPFGTGSSVPWLDQIVDSVGGLLYGAAIGIGAIGGVMAAHFKAKADKKTFDIQTSAAEIDAITKRFEALIDGYERRVLDLTNEVHALRGEVVALRKALDARIVAESGK